MLEQTKETLKSQIKRFEGVRKFPYTCTQGKITIGVGHNLTDNGLPEHLIETIFILDLIDALKDLESIFGELEGGHLIALTDLRFNLGATRFRTFKKLINFVKEKDWINAAVELEDSKWWNQVQPDRGNLIRKQLLTGELS